MADNERWDRIERGIAHLLRISARHAWLRKRNWPRYCLTCLVDREEYIELPTFLAVVRHIWRQHTPWISGTRTSQSKSLR